MKMYGSSFLRVSIAMLMWTSVIMCDINSRTDNRIQKPTKYPVEVHHLFQNRLSEKKLPTLGTWSAWSAWSPCSRNCGGGVTQQTRRCVPITSSSHKRKDQLHKRKSKKYCIGRYKRFHVCNIQECPTPIDFRRQQCIFFNRYPFRGQLYHWEPFLQAGDECALNCRPIGASFFATLKKTVIDGTVCYHPYTVTGKPAPPGTKGMCVDGKCMSVASNGVVGALDEEPEGCHACARGACQTYSGLYQRPDIPPGYSLITEIPAGACKITVQQMKHTKNHIALKYTNGSYILNGDWNFNPNHHSLEAAGTRFTYRKQDMTTTETILAPGPLLQPIEIMIVGQQPNEGIKYVYFLPMASNDVPQIAPPLLKRSQTDSNSVEPHRVNIPLNGVGVKDEHHHQPSINLKRRVRRRFIWKLTGFTPCNKLCGGGLQTTIYSCVKEHNHMVVPERRCTNLEKPHIRQIKCNNQPCSPIWNGFWGPCSGSCGQGIQQFIYRCEQEGTPGQTTIVNDNGCPQPKPVPETRQCTLPACENSLDNEVHPNPPSRLANDLPEWGVGPWSQCSVSCGIGHRTRAVTCPSGRCNPEIRPPHLERCEGPPCPGPERRSSWLTSEWSECSTLCGMGTQTRQSFCFVGNCEEDLKPEISRACSTYKLCNGQWFTGPWGPCSDSCNGPARQKRDVLCIIKIRGQPHVTNDMTCNHSEKPYEEQACDGSCPSKWFAGEWDECEGNCSDGVQRREIRCLDAYGRHSNECESKDMPLVKKPCACKKMEEPNVQRLPQDEPVDSSCIDKLQTCPHAVQARLCKYAYYEDKCCRSCRKFRQEEVH